MLFKYLFTIFIFTNSINSQCRVDPTSVSYQLFTSIARTKQPDAKGGVGKIWFLGDYALKETKPQTDFVEESTLKELEILENLQGYYQFANYIPKKCFVSKAVTIMYSKVGFDNVYYLMPRYQGDLHKMDKRNMNVLDKFDLMFKLLRAYQLLHIKGFLHLDTKPENIFMMTDMTPVLADFGFAMRQTDIRTFMCGTPGFLAPEIEKIKTPSYTEYADVYALGMVFYELITGLDSGTIKTNMAENNKDYKLFKTLIQIMTSHILPTGVSSSLIARCNMFLAEEILKDSLVPIIDSLIPPLDNNQNFLKKAITGLYNTYYAEDKKRADENYIIQARIDILTKFFDKELKLYEQTALSNKNFNKYKEEILADYAMRKSKFFEILEKNMTNIPGTTLNAIQTAYYIQPISDNQRNYII